LLSLSRFNVLTVNESRELAPLLLVRHVLLTIRNLTQQTAGFIECSTMNVITVKRTIFRRGSNRRLEMRRSFREVTRSYFARESNLEFAIEALFFAIIVAISAWPIFATAGALNEFLPRAAV
jgi:hypothetical protein